MLANIVYGANKGKLVTALRETGKLTTEVFKTNECKTLKVMWILTFMAIQNEQKFLFFNQIILYKQKRKNMYE